MSNAHRPHGQRKALCVQAVLPVLPRQNTGFWTLQSWSHNEGESLWHSASEDLLSPQHEAAR